LPIKPANYQQLDAGKAGTLFVSEGPDVPRFARGQQAITVSKFDLNTRKTDSFVNGVQSFEVSVNGEKVLYRQGQGWFIAGTAAAPKPGEGALKLDAMEVYVDPRVEWNQMYREVWRIERDFLYDPNLHGLNIPAAEKKYAPYLKALGGRADLNYLFDEMLGEISIGHMFIRGGDVPKAPKVKGGLLGADYKIENGRYRFARVFNGENWNPDLRAPLTQPGVDVKAGEYLLEVNGVDVRPPDDVSKFRSTQEQIYGPKTMVINEMSGSGGDALPWMFKQDGVGPLVGTRTWGGLVGIWNFPPLMDGGFVTAPRGAIYGLHGEWEVENRGIAPDIEVENDPASVAADHDPQLER
jgi:hypothetical protein